MQSDSEDEESGKAGARRRSQVNVLGSNLKFLTTFEMTHKKHSTFIIRVEMYTDS